MYSRYSDSIDKGDEEGGVQGIIVKMSEVVLSTKSFSTLYVIAARALAPVLQREVTSACHVHTSCCLATVFGEHCRLIQDTIPILL